MDGTDYINRIDKQHADYLLNKSVNNINENVEDTSTFNINEQEVIPKNEIEKDDSNNNYFVRYPLTPFPFDKIGDVPPDVLNQKVMDVKSDTSGNIIYIDPENKQPILFDTGLLVKDLFNKEPLDNSIDNQTSRLQEVQETFKEQYNFKDPLMPNYLSAEDVAAIGTELAEQLTTETSYRGTTIADAFIARFIKGRPKNTKAILQVGYFMESVGAGSLDGIEAGLTSLQQSNSKIANSVFSGIDIAMAGGRYSPTNDPKKLADRIGGNIGVAMEFLETLPIYEPVLRATFIARAYKRTKKQEARRIEDLRRNPNLAMGANWEANWQKEILAAKIADDNPKIKISMLEDFERRMAFKSGILNPTPEDLEKFRVYEIVNKKIILDEDKLLAISKDIRDDIVTMNLGEDYYDKISQRDDFVVPIFKPQVLDAMVAIAADFKKEFPKKWNNKKSPTQNIYALMLRGDITEEKAVAAISKYGIDFEDYALSIVGAVSDAASIMGKWSQLSKRIPSGRQENIKTKKMLEAMSDADVNIRRLESVRLGFVVSKVATAMRNLQSAFIRAPLEGLSNVFDEALYQVSTNGYIAGGKSLYSKENWKDSFTPLTYIFSRPDRVEGMAKLILSNKNYADQFDLMYNQLNEIQNYAKKKGYNPNPHMDNVLTELEDLTRVLNTPNRWQEMLVRNAAFLGKLEVLVKREYGIDLIDTMQAGKFRDLVNDNPEIRKINKDDAFIYELDGKEISKAEVDSLGDNAKKSVRKISKVKTFEGLINESVQYALDVTYANKPDNKFLKSMVDIINQNSIAKIPLTTAVMFPRFMAKSAEYIAMLGAGGSVPLTRKLMSVANSKLRGPLTDNERKYLSRNLAGIIAGTGTGFAILSSYIDKLVQPKEGSTFDTFTDYIAGSAQFGAFYWQRQYELNKKLYEYKGKIINDWEFSQLSDQEKEKVFISDDAPPPSRYIKVGKNEYLDTNPIFPMRQFRYLVDLTIQINNKTFDAETFDSKEFLQVFTGSNFRQGTGHTILNEAANLIAGTKDIVGDEKSKEFGIVLGRLVGEWGGTTLVPLTQIIDAQRAAEEIREIHPWAKYLIPELLLPSRTSEIKDRKKEPFSNGATFMSNLIDFDFSGMAESVKGSVILKPIQRSGLFTSAKEEELLPTVEGLYSDKALRMYPTYRLTLGLSMYRSLLESGEYLHNLGLKAYEFKSKFESPKAIREHTRLMRSALPTIVRSLKEKQNDLEKEWDNDPLLQNAYTRKQYTSYVLRAKARAEMGVLKTFLRDRTKYKASSQYIDLFEQYSKISKTYRSAASVEFFKKFKRRPFDQISSKEDIISIEKLIQEKLKLYDRIPELQKKYPSIEEYETYLMTSEKLKRNIKDINWLLMASKEIKRTYVGQFKEKVDPKRQSLEKALSN